MATGVEDITSSDIIDREEKQKSGGISLKTYKLMCDAVNNTAFVAFILVVFIAAQLAVGATDYLVSRWFDFINITFKKFVCNQNKFISIRVNWEEARTHNATQDDDQAQQIQHFYKYFLESFDSWSERDLYMLTYAILIAIAVTLFVYRSFAFFQMFLRASINLHDKLFRGIACANMQFFNSNPSGRILNRFAGDINNLDTILPQVAIDCADVRFFFLGNFNIFCLLMT